MDTAVETRDLVKIYDGKVRALDGLDLRVEAGKVFALLGPNGAGKTTLMRILTTQLTPSSGEAYVFGLNVTQDGAKVRKLISYVPQEMSVWTDITGYENLLIYAKIFGLPAQTRKSTISEVLGAMGLAEVANSRVSTYSGGMIRRLEVACALLIKPKIAFLDEPTIGLDPAAKKIVWERLRSFKMEYGVTVFFNTHYMDEADLYSDEIAIIDQGKIVKLGTAEELKRSLGGDVILLNLGNATPQELVPGIVGKVGLVKDVIMNGSELSVVTENAEIALPQVVEALRSGNIPVEKISITKPTLDDVFLKYAGTRLETRGRISDTTHVRRMVRKG